MQLRRHLLPAVLAPCVLALGVGLSISLGCATVANLPQTQGEVQSGYTYIPIDPFAVREVPGVGCVGDREKATKEALPSDMKQPPYRELLESLPDNSVRMLIEQFDVSGKITYGPAKLGTQGGSYRVTVDYINADTINVELLIEKTMEDATSHTRKPVLWESSPSKDEYTLGSESYKVTARKSLANQYCDSPWITPSSELYRQCQADAERLAKRTELGLLMNLPVYVGIGLRVSATVDIIGASANISGIGIIGAEAEANRLKGTLVVQTLGVNGKSVAAALPINSELNRTTAQSAIVAVGAIKALLYAKGDTVVAPRVVGLYLPINGGKPLVNAIISELSSSKLEWRRPCVPPKNPEEAATPAPGAAAPAPGAPKKPAAGAPK